MSGLRGAVSFRSFWTDDQIKHLVAERVKDIIRHLYHHARTLLTFSTSKQQTYGWFPTNGRSTACSMSVGKKSQGSSGR